MKTSILTKKIELIFKECGLSIEHSKISAKAIKNINTIDFKYWIAKYLL